MKHVEKVILEKPQTTPTPPSKTKAQASLSPKPKSLSLPSTWKHGQYKSKQ